MEHIIYSRYSCRSYQNKALSREAIKSIIKAGMQAPSARNEQPWEFIAVTERETLNRMAEASPYANCLREAAAAVLVLADTRGTKDGAWWIQDISACIENMLLEAAYLGLGSVWLGMYPRQDRVEYLKELFQLPVYLIPVAALPLGYPREEGKAQNRYREEKIHWEGFPGCGADRPWCETSERMCRGDRRADV